MAIEAENVTANTEEKAFVSEVKIAGDVIATIAGLAATEVEGIVALQGNITNDLVGKRGMKNLSKGVNIKFNEDSTGVFVALALVVQYGYSIPKATKAVQERVKNAIESMAGLTVTEVNVNVIGVSPEA